MSGGNQGGAPGPGVTHASADCPACGRVGVSGGIDHQTGHIILRKHKTIGAYFWCSDGQRVDAGPASPLLAYALEEARKGTVPVRYRLLTIAGTPLDPGEYRQLRSGRYLLACARCGELFEVDSMDSDDPTPPHPCRGAGEPA